MKIRAITGFIDPGWPIDTGFIAKTAHCLKDCRSSLQDAGFDVQTLRIATPPPSEMSTPVAPADRPDMARRLEAEIFIQGIDYAAIGPALPDEPDGFRMLPKLLAATDTVFSSGLYADPTVGLSLPAARACARAIQEISTIGDDGFGNLRFAALVNVPSGVPFFPADWLRQSRRMQQTSSGSPMPSPAIMIFASLESISPSPHILNHNARSARRSR
jgi:uncharacterized protein (UPF0210 family)